MRNIREYKQILAKKGYYFAFQEVKKRVFRLRFIRNIGVIEEDEKDRVYMSLKKYLKATHVNNKAQPLIFTNKIWFCWLQGIKNAPDIVKQCYKSLQQHCADMEIIVLTANNISDYIDLPDYINQKYAKGNITQAHFSDIVRIAILAQYGGIWADATCFFTGSIPKYVLEQPLFCFKSFLFRERIKASSWFIAAQPNNKIICETRNLLCEYWRDKRFLRHYFLFHLCFSLVIDSCGENKTCWHQIPVFPNTNPHLLQFELFEDFNLQRFEQICNLSFVHKLTYKFNKEQQKLLNKRDTFYQKILNFEI